MADIQLEITGVSEHVPLILEAFQFYEGNSIEMSSPLKSDRFEFTFPVKGNDTNKDFAENVVKECIKAIVKMYKLGQDRDRYSSDVSNVTLPDHNVPDGIVQ